MTDKKVKEIMISVNDYPIVDHEASIFDAIKILEKSYDHSRGNKHPYRAVLVSQNNKIIGKIGHLTFLKALEPNYERLQMDETLIRANLSSDFIDAVKTNFNLWENNFIDICSRAAAIIVKDIMKPIKESINGDSDLIEAMHKMIMWQTLSIPVVEGGKIIGIIRLSDLYEEFATFISGNCCNNSNKNQEGI